MDRDAGVLLFPKSNQRLGDPDPDGAQPVEANVAGCADGNQQPTLMDAGLTVMHMELVPCPTGLAGAAVALQNLVAEAPEALAGAGGGAVARAAEAAGPGEIPAAGAQGG